MVRMRYFINLKNSPMPLKKKVSRNLSYFTVSSPWSDHEPGSLLLAAEVSKKNPPSLAGRSQTCPQYAIYDADTYLVVRHRQEYGDICGW